jgi:hypothetical protein
VLSKHGFTSATPEKATQVQANFIQYQGLTVVYRRYASLFFMVGIDNGQVWLLPFRSQSFAGNHSKRSAVIFFRK